MAWQADGGILSCMGVEYFVDERERRRREREQLDDRHNADGQNVMHMQYASISQYRLVHIKSLVC